MFSGGSSLDQFYDFLTSHGWSNGGIDKKSCFASSEYKWNPVATFDCSFNCFCFKSRTIISYSSHKMGMSGIILGRTILLPLMLSLLTILGRNDNIASGTFPALHTVHVPRTDHAATLPSDVPRLFRDAWRKFGGTSSLDGSSVVRNLYTGRSDSGVLWSFSTTPSIATVNRTLTGNNPNQGMQFDGQKCVNVDSPEVGLFLSFTLTDQMYRLTCETCYLSGRNSGG